MTGYHPIMMPITNSGIIRSIVGRCADRFAKLNGVRPRMYMSAPPGAPTGIHPAFYKAWIWDMVPPDVNKVMFIDYDIVPVRPLGELPDCLFGACVGPGHGPATGYFPFFKPPRTYLNTGLFLADRQTQPIFNRLKAFSTAYAKHTLMGINEQVPLNMLIQAELTPLVLPDDWNYQITMTWGEQVDKPKMIHLSDMKSERWVLMSQMLDALEYGTVDLELGQLVGSES